MRVSSTTSPLADPQTPIHRLAARLQEFLFLPDPSPLYTVCGCVTANIICGYPVWLMLIAPASGGKTDLLKPLLKLDGVMECGDLSGKAALLSGVKKKDMSKDAKGGLLKELSLNADGLSRGILIMLDFARTILAADPASAKATLGALGMLYDKHYERRVGTEGGRALVWDGRVGFIAATTDAIDDAHAVNAEMGERCLYYRYPQSDGFHETMAALNNPDADAKDEAIRQCFLDWAAEMEFDWNDPLPPRELTQAEKLQITALASFSARGRSGVTRDWREREIISPRRAELAPRLATGMAQLLRGMEHTGVSAGEAWKILCQIAFDNMPVTRAEAIGALLKRRCGTSEIAHQLRLSLSAAVRVLEDLEVHTVVDRVSPGLWELSAWSRAQLKSGWGSEIVLD